MNKYFKNEPLWNLFSEALEQSDTGADRKIRHALANADHSELGRLLHHTLEKYWDDIEDNENFEERMREETGVDIPFFFQEQAS